MNGPVLTKRVLLLAVVALAVVNGIYSPKLIGVFALQYLWYPSFLPQNFQVVFVVSAVVLATLHLMLAGVPAALFEKFSSYAEPTIISRVIWLATMLLLSIPSLSNIG